MIDLMELMTKEEPIHPDLLPYIQSIHAGMTFLNHPLVQELCPSPNKGGLINHRYKMKLEGLDEAIKKEDPASYVYLHERPYRLQALKDYLRRNKINSSIDYWKLVGTIWTDSENIWQNKRDWQRIWCVADPFIHASMTEDERESLTKLPTSFTIYRGISEKGWKRGFSWTLSEKKAKWFAQRYSANQPIIGSTVITKTQVKAHFLGRNENEIVVCPPPRKIKWENV